ncbi:MAG TPA: alpha/beta fold hydrolase, partial [Vicinamibacteria bacterium]
MPRRSGAALVGVLVLGLAGFAYRRPVAVAETYGAVRLRLQGVTSAHVQAGPYRLHYLEAGSGPPLLLVHGLGSNATMEWGRLMAPLGRKYRVLAPDLPGFGDSARPASADYSIAMQVEAVLAFMKARGIERTRLAGISMGGWI